MGIFNDGEPPPLYVPDLSKPAGATVDADGNVTCVACGTKLPLARADVVGQGYRCAPCSAKAELAKLTGGSDVAANLSEADRSALSSAGAALLWPGVLMVIGGVALFAIVPGTRLSIYLLIGGIATAGLGLGRMRAAR